jgi:hypothetical protein
MRGLVTSEQQPSRHETIQRRFQLCLRLARDRREQGMRKLAADCRRDLRQLLGGSPEPVEPRHERGMQACGHGRCPGRNRGHRALGGYLTACLQHRFGHFLHEQGNTVATLDDVLANARR